VLITVQSLSLEFNRSFNVKVFRNSEVARSSDQCYSLNLEVFTHVEIIETRKLQVFKFQSYDLIKVIVVMSVSLLEIFYLEVLRFGRVIGFVDDLTELKNILKVNLS
jgi:hypothetical protein